MLNRAVIAPRVAAQDSSEWEIERHPRLRLAGLFGLFLLALVTIAVRLAHVQASLGDDYAAEFDKTIERRESISSRDGRILSADGQVLAEDVELFDLKVHYRWLEEPVDPAWLRQQALSKLDRAGRRKPERVAAEQATLLRRRDELWRRLATVTGFDQTTLVRKRAEIQRRVEHIHELVERRRIERQAPEPAAGPIGNGPAGTGDWWSRAWSVIVATLTTPPQREPDEPLVVREQLEYHVLLAEIPIETAIEIEAHPERYPGTRIDGSTRRVYPQGSAAAHLIGYRLPLDDDAIDIRRRRFPQGDPLDYRTGDRQGRAGLELQYERQLRGLRGERKSIFDRRGELLASETVRAPRYGNDLHLSLHLALQQAAEQLLDEQLQTPHFDATNGKPLPIPPGGAIVALDVRTGAVLAAASAPRFDLRMFGDRDSALWQQALADARKPLFHRAVRMALPPGSIFKVVSAIAFLESGGLDPERMFHCQGFLDEPDRLRCFTFRNFGVGHGDVNLVSALSRSCNVYFFSAARRIGAAPLQDWAGRFGFGEPTGIDLPGESSGNLPVAAASGIDRAGLRSTNRATGDALQLAIGQARLTATPLQIARMMAAIANGGSLVTPKLVDSAGAPSNSTSAADGPRTAAADYSRIADLSARSLEWVKLGMRQTVAHPQGTGYKTVRSKDVAIAGKTGTAETGAGRPDHAWFAGYVPADRPTVAFVVVLEHAGPGGHAAGPVAHEFVQAMQALGIVDGTQVAAPNAN